MPANSSSKAYLIIIAIVFLISGFLFIGLLHWNNTVTLRPLEGATRQHNSLSELFSIENTTATRSSKYRPSKKTTSPPAESLSADSFYLDASVVASQYSINPAPCSTLPVKPYVVIIVFARPNGYKLRQAIRSTWGSLVDTHCGVRMLFMFGRVYDSAVQEALNEESKKYGDVIQSNQFDDRYRSAANKAVHLLQWGAAFCPESAYTAKIDDDNWLNLQKYLNFLKAHPPSDIVYGGMFYAGTIVIRDPNSKYFVPREEFPQEYYPEYLSGILYAFPTKHLAKVVYMAQHSQMTFNDDVFVCGVVATKAGLTRKEVPDYGWDHNIHDTTCPKRDKMCIHYSKIEDFYRLWNDPCFKYEKLC
ncbi:beta-1,3-galactosyltransferase 5-like [Paramacrobiotus metropolitanus]|uniref:beta-1,3-galactosyltransferase 5-like n=1 Tax=Paramacrobiotus metropolitanus TaxID=2943436 RepID=UPI002446336D|nr:beta-1,3-galactosyltransferase 5-like [Paramacrobiotus metropolitanus]